MSGYDLLWIPVWLFPYLAPACLYCLSSSTLMTEVLHSNALPLFQLFILLGLLALAASVALLIRALTGRLTPVQALRGNAALKLLQIPAYLILFGMGTLLVLALFTAPFALIFLLFDGVSILLCGLPGLGWLLRARREGLLDTRHTVWYSVLQFVFCLDLVGALLAYRRVRRSAGNDPSICR